MKNSRLNFRIRVIIVLSLCVVFDTLMEPHIGSKPCAVQKKSESLNSICEISLPDNDRHGSDGQTNKQTDRRNEMKFYEAKVKEIKKETSDTYSFIMDIPEGFTWKAGQHVLWKLKDYSVAEGDKDARVFTIASAPEDGFLMFTTRITELHSSFKDILLNKLEPGDTMLVATPLGNFTLDAEDYPKTLIIAGGIGITPIRSLLRSYMEHPVSGHQITVLYSDDRGEYAYEEFWKQLKAAVPDIELNFLTEREKFTCMTDSFAGANGNDAEYLVAGSPGMNTAFTERLQGLGV